VPLGGRFADTVAQFGPDRGQVGAVILVRVHIDRNPRRNQAGSIVDFFWTLPSFGFGLQSASTTSSATLSSDALGYCGERTMGRFDWKGPGLKVGLKC